MQIKFISELLMVLAKKFVSAWLPLFLSFSFSFLANFAVTDVDVFAFSHSQIMVRLIVLHKVVPMEELLMRLRIHGAHCIM